MSDADVAEAARATRAAGTARFWGASFGTDALAKTYGLVPSTRRELAGQLSERYGVADLIARRMHAHVRYIVGDALVDSLLERWPWLDDRWDEEDGEDEDDWIEIVANGAFSDSPFDVVPAKDVRGNPQGYSPWILDGLTAVRASRRIGADSVRGEDCTRYGFRAELADADVANLGRRWIPAITGNAWIGADERIRRVVWADDRPTRRRQSSVPLFWTVLELWDFGIPVDIPESVPKLNPSGGSVSLRDLRDVLGQFRAQRRAWKRAQSGST